ncbi:rho GTPase-activating protein 19 isoform X1 [Daktulosphaira vitifoliae]|uniref:rho GTPase-activating protein 19 isoform X1 n=1 Tax=Daktulosphaira vitifoliae TaxID=58002 RepID=UPI0021AA5FEB|nr:rho GTPase-activating protein 19 isoform X1 [Daktulosphaira vitifoliae]
MAMELLDMNEDWKLANKLRVEDSEQFYTLVRMHLSFILESNIKEGDNIVEEKSKIKPIKWSFLKKDKYPVKGVMDGAPITQEGICQVYQLIDFLSQEENIIQEGIFRRNGSINRQQELKSLLNQGQTLDLYNSQFTVHDCATVLKSFLAEQPEPLMTEAFYPAYCQISEFCQKMEVNNNGQRLLRALQLLLLLLPFDNLVLLKDIIKLLHFTAKHSDKNRMPPDNLATLFTGHLLVPRKLPAEEIYENTRNLSQIVIYMINLGFDLFKIPPNLAVDIRAYWSKKTLQPVQEEGTVATTVFSFTDRTTTTKENEEDPTVKALAELYAHVQSLPESAEKRRMFIKRVSNHSSVITPNRSLTNSIKKHIFKKGSKIKHGPIKSNERGDVKLSEEKFKSSSATLSDKENKDDSFKIKRKDTSKDLQNKDTKKSKAEVQCSPDLESCNPVDCFSTPNMVKRIKRCTSTPSAVTPHQSHPNDDMSPITQSAQKMTKSMQETMMTPRSRKPVIALSNSNIHKIKSCNNDLSITNQPSSQSLNSISSNPYYLMTSGDSLSSSFRDYLFSQSVLTASPVDLSFGDTSSSSTQSLLSDIEDNLLQYQKSNTSTENLTKRKRLVNENVNETLL